MHPVGTLHVRLTPRASQDAVEGWEGDVLRVRVHAPALEGRANVALLRILAGRLGVPKGAVVLRRGKRSRHKTIQVYGLGDAELRRRLNAD